MALVDLRQLAVRLEFLHRSDGSKAQRLRLAIAAVQEGLQVLASAGHPMHLEEGLVPNNQLDWPRLYFRYGGPHDLEQREVLDPWEAQELGAGWFPSLGAAIQAYGEAVQFAGRGGVRRWRGVTPQGEAEFVPNGLPSKTELKAAFRLAHPNGVAAILSNSKPEI